jgi:hypothetical protein
MKKSGPQKSDLTTTASRLGLPTGHAGVSRCLAVEHGSVVEAELGAWEWRPCLPSFVLACDRCCDYTWAILWSGLVLGRA